MRRPPSTVLERLQRRRTKGYPLLAAWGGVLLAGGAIAAMVSAGWTLELFRHLPPRETPPSMGDQMALAAEHGIFRFALFLRLVLVELYLCVSALGGILYRLAQAN